MLAHIKVPPPEPPPGTYVPPEVPPLVVPPSPGLPPRIDDPTPEPTLPIREPGTVSPPQAADLES